MSIFRVIEGETKVVICKEAILGVTYCCPSLVQRNSQKMSKTTTLEM